MVVVADPADCSLQFDPVGKAKFVSACDIAKGALANAGVPYRNAETHADGATIKIGDAVLTSPEGSALSPQALAAAKTTFQASLKHALADAGGGAFAEPCADEQRPTRQNDLRNREHDDDQGVVVHCGDRRMSARYSVHDPSEVGGADKGRKGGESIQGENSREGAAIGPHVLAQCGPDLRGVSDGQAGVHGASSCSGVAAVRETVLR